MDAAFFISISFFVVVILLVGMYFFADWQSGRFESKISDGLEISRNSRAQYQKYLLSFSRYASKEPFKSRMHDLENKLRKWQNIESRIFEEYKRTPTTFTNLVYEYYQRIQYYFQLRTLDQRCDELFTMEQSVQLSADNLKNIIPKIHQIVQGMYRNIQKSKNNFDMLTSHRVNGTDFERASERFSEITLAMQSLPDTLKKAPQNTKITHDDITRAFPVIDQHKAPLDELLKQTSLWRELVSEYDKLTVEIAMITHKLETQIKDMPANIDVSTAQQFLKTMEENVQRIQNESRTPNVSRLKTSIQHAKSMIHRTESLINELRQTDQNYQAAKDLMVENTDRLNDLAGEMNSFKRLGRYPIAWGQSARQHGELRRMVDANTVSSGIMSAETIGKRLNVQQECRSEIEQLYGYVKSLASLRKSIVTVLAGNEQIFREDWLMKASAIAVAAKPYHRADLSHKEFLDRMDAIIPALQTLKRDLKYALKDQTFQESELAEFSRSFLLKTYAQDLSHFNAWVISSETELQKLESIGALLAKDTDAVLIQLRQWEGVLSDVQQAEGVRTHISLMNLIQNGDTLLDELQKHERPMRELQHAISRWKKECEVAAGDLWKNLEQQWKKLRDDLTDDINEIESVAYCANESALLTAKRLIRQNVKGYPGWFSDIPRIFGKDASEITNLLEVWTEMFQVKDLLYQTVGAPLFSAFQPIKDDMTVLENRFNYLARMSGTEGYPDSYDIHRWRKLLEHQRERLKRLRKKGKNVSHAKQEFLKVARELERLKQEVELYGD